MKKILSVLLAAALTMLSFTGCPEKEAKSSGPKGPDKETLALYEKSKELNHKLLNITSSASREEQFLEKAEGAEKWDIKTVTKHVTERVQRAAGYTEEEYLVPDGCGTDEAGINDLAGIYIGYTPIIPLNTFETENIAYIYLGKDPDKNGLYPAYIYYVGAAYGLKNYKEETSYKEKYNDESFNCRTHAGSWSIDRTTDNLNRTNTVIKLNLPEEMKRDGKERLKNDQGFGFSGKSDWVHYLGHPYIIDGKKTIVSIDGIYIKMD